MVIAGVVWVAVTNTRLGICCGKQVSPAGIADRTQLSLSIRPTDGILEEEWERWPEFEYLSGERGLP